MASPFSLTQIIESLKEAEAGTHAEVPCTESEEVWTYVATREQVCASCGRAILPGQKVAVGYKGKIALFVHAKEKA